MKSYVSALVVDGETATPYPVNDELLNVAGTANRLDDENFAANALPSTALALGATHRLLHDAIETARTVTVDFRDVTGTGAVQPLPDASGAPWAHTMETYGGALYLALQVAMEDATNELNNYVWIQIMVDGEVVAQSGDQAGQTYADSWYAHAVVPVAAGSHVIELSFGTSLPTEANGAAGAGGDLEFSDRSFVALEILQ